MKRRMTRAPVRVRHRKQARIEAPSPAASPPATAHAAAEPVREEPCLWGNCDATFETRVELGIHLSEHVAHATDKRCAWQGCKASSKRFRTTARLEKHVSEHTGLRAHICPLAGCGKSFDRAAGLEIHLQGHFGEVERLGQRRTTDTEAPRNVPLPPVRRSLSESVVNALQAAVARFEAGGANDLTAQTATFAGEVLGQRTLASGGEEVLVRWVPPILPTEWMAPAAFVTPRTVLVATLSPTSRLRYRRHVLAALTDIQLVPPPTTT